jgi:hypothetical protein
VGLVMSLIVETNVARAGDDRPCTHRHSLGRRWFRGLLRSPRNRLATLPVLRRQRAVGAGSQARV